MTRTTFDSTSIPAAFTPVFLEPKIWDSLHHADSLEDYAGTWLELLCASIVGAERAVVVLRKNSHEPYAPLICWPRGEPCGEALMQAAEASLQANQGLYRQSGTDSGQLAHPVRDAAGVRGVVALELRGVEPSPLAMRLLQWGLAGLQLALLRLENNPAAQATLRPVLDCTALVLEQEGFDAACNALSAHLAISLNCRRAALGFMRGRRHHLKTLSHSVSFSEKTQLARALEAVMDEAADLRRCVSFPPPREEEGRLYPAHARLAGRYGGHKIYTIPILGNDETVLGAAILEREEAFEPPVCDLAEAAVNVSGLILALKRDSEQGALSRAGMQTRTWLHKSFGPGYLRWKAVLLLLLSIAGLAFFGEGRFRIAADAYLEAAVQQSVVAPMDGFISAAPRRAGDLVKAGDLLFSLDDADLLLEQAKLEHQLKQYREKYRNALAQHERAEISVLKAQLEQVEAQLDLNARQLARTQGHAPFEGMLASGDLSQKQGAPVKRGEVLFEVAPLQDYRLVLQVDERDIAEIQQEQQGELVLAGAAQANLAFKVNRITPVAETREGRNFFRVEADLSEQSPALLQPGMKGVGKIEAGRRPLLWIWTRGMLNWLRLWLWSWWP